MFWILCADDRVVCRNEGFLSPLAALVAVAFDRDAVLLIAMVSLLHTSYAEYIRGTHWLVALLGPASGLLLCNPEVTNSER